MNRHPAMKAVSLPGLSLGYEAELVETRDEAS